MSGRRCLSKVPHLYWDANHVRRRTMDTCGSFSNFEMPRQDNSLPKCEHRAKKEKRRSAVRSKINKNKYTRTHKSESPQSVGFRMAVLRFSNWVSKLMSARARSSFNERLSNESQQFINWRNINFAWAAGVRDRQTRGNNRPPHVLFRRVFRRA